MTTQISDLPLISNIISESTNRAITLEDSDIKMDIENYFITKKAYYDFIAGYKPKKTFNITIDKINTNYPLRFYESRNSLLLDIIDPDTNTPVYRKKIVLLPSINLDNEYFNLRKLINEHKFTFDKSVIYDKINKLKRREYLLELGAQNGDISNEEFKLEKSKLQILKSQIQEEYDNLSNTFNNFVSKFIDLDRMIKNRFRNNLENLNTQLITLHRYSLIINDIHTQINNMSNISLNNIGLVELLKQYNILYLLLFNKNNTISSNSLVVKKEDFIAENKQLKMNYILIVEKIENKNTLICRDIGGQKQVLDINSVNHINSISQMVNDMYMDFTEQDQDSDIVIGNVVINNIGNENNYIKPDSVKYFDITPIEKKSIVKKKQTIIKKQQEFILTNNILKDDTLDFSTQLFVGLHNLSKPYPGKGVNENIDNETFKKGDFDNLNSQKKWRALLSENYIFRSSNNIIRPIIIDGEEFSSVGHYRLYCKYARNSDFSNKFVLTREFGKLNAELLQNKGLDSYIVENWSEVEHNCLVKANYAKFTQNDLVKSILDSTLSSIIVSEDINVRETIKYRYMNALMEVRKLIASTSIPDNYSRESIREDITLSENSSTSTGLSLENETKSNRESVTEYRLPVFQFYSKSKNKPLPGKGSGEYIDPSDQNKFNDLAKISNWRLMLSNFWEQEFSLDEKKWLSVEHFYQASKFVKNNKDYYDTFSMDSSSELSQSALNAQKAGIKSSKTRPKNITMDRDFTVTGRDKKVMFRAMMAKFSQNSDLKETLLSTKNAELRHFSRGKTPILFTELMRVRDILLLEKLRNLNYLGDDKLIQITQKVKVNYSNNTKIFNIGTYFIYNVNTGVIKSIDDNTIVGRLSLTFDKFKYILDDNSLSKERTEKHNEQKTNDDSSANTNDIYNRQLNNAREILSKNGFKISGLSSEQILDTAVKINSLNDGYFGAFRNLETIVNEKYPHHNIMHVPPDGDCLYYSIVELLSRENIFPLNFRDGEEEGQLSREKTNLLLMAGNSSKRGPILREAANQLRNMVADKLLVNLDVQSEAISTIRASLDNTDSYINSIRNSASPLNSGEKGSWGGDLEIKLISAIIGIKIITILSNGSIITYLPDKNRLLFPNGSELNNIINDKQIYLGYLEGGNHYIGISEESVTKSPSAILEEMNSYELMENYFYKSVEYDNIPYNLAIIKIDDETIEPRGFYDTVTKKILYEEDLGEYPEKDEIYDNLLNSLNDISDSATLIPIEYYKDIVQNTVHINSLDGSKVKIGVLVDDETDDEISIKKIKFD